MVYGEGRRRRLSRRRRGVLGGARASGGAFVVALSDLMARTCTRVVIDIIPPKSTSHRRPQWDVGTDGGLAALAAQWASVHHQLAQFANVCARNCFSERARVAFAESVYEESLSVSTKRGPRPSRLVFSIQHGVHLDSRVIPLWRAS